MACIGNAGGAELNTTVFPFILRGVSLLGADPGRLDRAARTGVRTRLAGDLRPRHLGEVARVIAFDELPAAFGAYIAGQVKGRTVVRISED